MKILLPLSLCLLAGCSSVHIESVAANGTRTIATATVPAWPWQDSAQVVQRLNASAATNRSTISMREPTEAKWACKNGRKPMKGAPGGHGPYVTSGNCPECGIPLVPLNSRESTLHDSIIDYCNSQWPKWKYIHARMDKRSTIAKGAQDFTIFMPGGRLLCVECKRKGEKPTQEQLAWAKEMEMLNHKIFLVTSMTEFLECVGKNKAAS